MSGSPCPVVTIDGPSGSGKGTISRAVARHAGWHLLDSGALYRLAALAGSRAGLDPNDITAHAQLARNMSVAFRAGTDGGELVLLDGLDVTRDLRSEAAG